MKRCTFHPHPRKLQQIQVNKNFGHRTPTIMDGGLDAPALLGSRCQSSSVTKGMKGCSRRSPVSRQTHSVSRVRFFAASSDPCMIGLMISMNTPHSLYCQKSYTTVVAAGTGDACELLLTQFSGTVVKIHCLALIGLIFVFEEGFERWAAA